MRDEPHRPTHWNHQHVSQPQIRHCPDDARQRPQDPKDLHGLHQTFLRGDSRRNRRPNQERQRDVVMILINIVLEINPLLILVNVLLLKMVILIKE